jgi:membrane complex biogenesis BtpA family protein
MRFIGMIHLLPLPGSPQWGGSMRAVLERALDDARKLIDGGVNAVMVENMGDVPYLRGRAEPETIAAMALAVHQVAALGTPTGVQVLAGANLEALSIAATAGAAFIRVESFAYAHVADEGWLDACAGELLRKRRQLGVQVEVWADVQKKHAAHAVTADLPLSDLAKGTAFCGADALIVTGKATGEATDAADVIAAKSAGIPVMVGSGVTPENASSLADADGLIVGSWLKVGGDWRNPVDPGRVRQLAALIRR